MRKPHTDRTPIRHHKVAMPSRKSMLPPESNKVPHKGTKHGRKPRTMFETKGMAL